MRFHHLSGIEKAVSVIGLGTGTPKAFAPGTYMRGAELLDAFLRAGGNFVDTAHVYGFGGSEKTIGRWLRERQARQEIVLSTKGCHPAFDPENIFGKPWEPRVTPEAIHQDLSESLERLQTDFVDVYLLHRDDERMPVAPMMDALHLEMMRGRIRAFGASNWSTARIAEANAYASKNNLRPFVLSSPSLSLPRPKPFLFPGALYAGDTVRAWHEQHQFPLLAWSSLGVGFMHAELPPKDGPDSFVAQTYFTDENFERLRRAQELAGRKNASTVQIGLAFVLHQRFPTIALVGPSTVAHLAEALRALDVRLNDNETGYLDLQRATPD